ncbi:AI-2E family transporter [Paraburkholderia caballeronis]|uniref:Predicted PurR-regulated permease PerM n=1 Tax=Paraburkholderia caballeronis TaxID=416943 RepID=A0A1H7SIR3_9BURK|nr:AI-2E family transporter [Paraburkholderia caballeronis]PXW17557.1 putative PurR-regulated permease PerM [Paraburkholderia caballeronis]PXW95146.1 putative PurR-regulated permease PerM [Paraburkholderia caballeronis]RAJ90992.1 putative PurR-regulated permease PerM [Paraburkholderia caballeronis]TDV07788.1 putative PurR-regulated permease PerM [Paraburkholderia caballeronis]TDV11151.1 putative PurR-regulated permease PerM [Paraburkholderia caballeronis]
MIRRPSAPNPANDPKFQRAASAVLYAVLVLLALWVVREFIPAVAWACVIAIVLWPAYQAIESHRAFRGRTTVIATLLTLAVALLVVLPIAVTVVQAAGEAHDLALWLRSAQQNGLPVPDFVAHLPFGSRQVAEWWQANLGRPLNTSSAMKGLHSDAVVSFGRQFGVRAVHAAMLFGFMLVTLFVILQAGPRLSGTVLQGARRAFGADGAQLLQRMAAAVRGTVTGLVVVGLGEGLLLGGAYLVTGVPHAALLGTVTAVAAMLPFCAPIVFCGAALWLLVQGDVAQAIGLVVWGFVVVFVAEHFVRPVLIGNSTRLPFLLVLFGILGGATTFGLLGIFIGPALMTVLMVLWNDWID